MQSICIIIPCYNESRRIDFAEFSKALQADESLHFLFVNDGSSDNTLELLQGFEAQHPGRVKAVNLAKNAGKAEAIRYAALGVMSWKAFSLAGYFDCDLSAPLSEVSNLRREINREEKFCIAYGSRLGLMGRKIKRRALRHYLGRIFATLASILLRMPVYDTQCGAKLFKPEIIPVLFSKPFITRWFFDVEMLFRLKRGYGQERVLEMVVEAPLLEWVEKKGSKLKFLDFIKVPFNLFRIYFYYRRYKPTDHGEKRPS